MPSCCVATDTMLNLIDKKGFSLVLYREREALNDRTLYYVRTHGDLDLMTAYFCSAMASMQAASDRLTYVERYVFATGQNLSAGKNEHLCKGSLDRALHGAFFKHMSYSILDVGLPRKQHYVVPI